MRAVPGIVALSCMLLLPGCLQESQLTDSEPSPSPVAFVGDGVGGEDLVVGGVGLYTQPASFSVNVPVSDPADILFAHFYWSGRSDTDDGDNTIVINGTEYVGTLLDSHELIGGTPWVFFYELDASSLVTPGINNFTVSGFEMMSPRRDGIGLAVIYADDASPWGPVQILTPNEFIYWGFASIGDDRTAVHAFPQVPSAEDREANLTLFVTDCEDTRSDELWWDSGSGAPASELIGSANLLSNQFFSNVGPEFDVYQKGGLEVSAGDDHFAYQLFSPALGNGDSMAHVFAALRVQRTPDDHGHLACRVTGGGVNEFGEWDGTFVVANGAGGQPVDRYQFGGQAGAPGGEQPQPYGEWTHHQQKGPNGSFVFHAGTHSSPDQTEIDLIECSDPGWCQQARQAPAKQIDFEGVGSFNNIKNAPAILAGVVPNATFHWFEVHIEDLGEPGRAGRQPAVGPDCPAEGSAGELANCGCPDFYSITIYKGVGAGAEPNKTDVIYSVYGYIQGGNLQIHPALD